ncbi:MAG: hypothetical protein KDA89_01055 [Planctomycetaceae bacterium]|nr:hypothetical protein [Planctomycetaceae bacterium]
MAGFIQEWVREGLEQGLEQGREQGSEVGRVEGLREAIFVVAELRFPAESEWVRMSVSQISSGDTLFRLLNQCKSAPDASDFRRVIFEAIS